MISSYRESNSGSFWIIRRDVFFSWKTAHQLFQYLLVCASWNIFHKFQMYRTTYLSALFHMVQLRGVPLNDCTIRSRGKIMRHRQMAILIGGCYDDGSAFERGSADRRHMRLTDRSAMVEKREQPKVTILWAQRDLRLAKHLHIYGWWRCCIIYIFAEPCVDAVRVFANCDRVKGRISISFVIKWLYIHIFNMCWFGFVCDIWRLRCADAPLIYYMRELHVCAYVCLGAFVLNARITMHNVDTVWTAVRREGYMRARIFYI